MKLFEKGKIGTMTLKNRVVMAPMGQPADTDGGFTQSNIDYMEERARGGTGLIITGCTVVSEEFEPRPCNLHNDFHQNDRLGMLADRVHFHGAKLCLQLSPGIGRMNFIDPFTPPYSASEVPSYAFPDLICKPLPVDGIGRLVKAMGYSASLAKRAGVDAVEIHAYGGYLIDQFMSAHWNKRTDQYGGSLENRMRFLLEIIAEIRATCGPDYPLIVKLTVDSRGEERPLEEGLEIARILAAQPIDALHIGRGQYSCRYNMVGTVYQPEGFDVDAVAEVKRMFPDLPILAHGKLNEPEVAEQALQDGCFDYAVIGHGLLADPHWANKVRRGRPDRIIPCIGCGECHFNSMNGKILSCAVNPTTGYERDYQLTPATDPTKKILVIGGGPGGMKAAITAADRGFAVSLWERNRTLGGEMAAAGAPRFKRDVAAHVDYLARELQRRDIDLRLGMTATLEDVRAFAPDFVVVATGSNPVRIPVPGHDLPHVMLAEEALLGKREPGDRVVVVGGGLVGCETALELSMQGRTVTVVEMLDDILKIAEHFVANDQQLRHMMRDSSVRVLTGARLEAIHPDHVEVSTADGKQRIDCDSVVFAAGFRSDHSLYEQIEAAGYEVVQIGDNAKPGKIIQAVWQGYHAIRVLSLA